MILPESMTKLKLDFIMFCFGFITFDCCCINKLN